MTMRGKSHAGKKEFTVECGERLGGVNMCGEEVGGESPPHQKIVNRLRHSYLNVMKLENCGPIGECLKDNH